MARGEGPRGGDHAGGDRVRATGRPGDERVGAPGVHGVGDRHDVRGVAQTGLHDTAAGGRHRLPFRLRDVRAAVLRGHARGGRGVLGARGWPHKGLGRGGGGDGGGGVDASQRRGR